MTKSLKNIYFTLIFLLPFSVLAQGGFKKHYHAPNSTLNYAKDVIEAPNSNIIISGIVADSVYGQRLSLLGLDSNGNELWRKNYGNSNFLFLNADYLSRSPLLKDNSGFYQPYIVWDSVNDYYSVLLRFNFNGDTLWQRKIISTIPNEYFYVHDVCHSVDGGLILTGMVADMNNGKENILIVKTDLNGNELWRKNLVSPITNPVSVWRINRSIQDSTSKKIVSVGLQYDSNWQSTALLFIADSLGNPIYSTSLSSIYGGAFSDLLKTKDGDFIAVGSDGSPQIISGIRAAWEYMVKFDATGNVIWKKKFSPPSPYQHIWTINESDIGDLILGSNANITENMIQISRIRKTDSQGNLKWTRDFEQGVNQIIPRSVNFGNNGNIFAVMELPTSSVSPFILIKMDSTGCDSTPVYCTNPLAIDEFYNKTGFSFEMFPNPANEKVTFKISAIVNEEFKIRITDLSGRQIQLLVFNQNETVEFDTKHFSSGIYFVSIISGGNAIETKKLVIAK